VNETEEEELADLRKLGVDDGDEGGEDGSEGEGGSLGAHEGTDEKTLSADKVLAEHLWKATRSV
jgi:hypothetical protein